MIGGVTADASLNITPIANSRLPAASLVDPKIYPNPISVPDAGAALGFNFFAGPTGITPTNGTEIGELISSSTYEWVEYGQGIYTPAWNSGNQSTSDGIVVVFQPTTPSSTVTETAIYNFNGATPGAATISGSHITADAISLGSTIIATVGDNSVGYPTPELRAIPAVATTAAAAVTSNDYFQFTIHGGAGLFLKRIQLKAARGGSSTPRGFIIRSSADGFASDLVADKPVPTIRTTYTEYDFPVNLDLTSPATLRFYIYGPIAGGSSIEFDDFIFSVPVSGSDTTAPVITNRTTVNIKPKTPLSLTLTSDDPAAVWTKTGGADQALFTLIGNTLTLPAQNARVIRQVQVTATDAASNSSNATITVKTTDFKRRSRAY
jgi:hypothetical protein